MAKANFTRQDIRRHLDQGAARIEAQIILRLQYLAEQTIAVARQPNSSWTDDTGNLRSSLGWLIMKDGKILDESFVQVKKGSDGMAAGRKHAREVSAEHPRGFVLVFVAGMHYAAVLEANGKDVLASAELFAKSKMPGLLQQLKRSINTMK